MRSLLMSTTVIKGSDLLPEIIAEVEKSSQDYREGKGTDYKNMAEFKEAMRKWTSDDAQI